ncbi:MAG TPA: NAD(P)-dependent oxidoreductase [Phycisphaerae bacterium]|nr:NAD(P)-dependent oxidoreductase [Phycisphaerae bacterium]
MILVTGAAGLVGRELVSQLIGRGEAVRGIDLLPADMPDRSRFSSQPREGLDLLTADLLDPAACRKACDGVATVVHTAARQHHSGVPRWGRERFFAANVEMTRNLVEASIAAGTKHFVLVSSDMVYGLPPGRPLVESDKPRPIGPYGRSKLASEKACIAARDRGLRVTVLRPRLIIGPGRLGILKKLFDCIRQDRRVPLLGSGRNRYQMVSVADVAEACLLAAQHPCDEILNLGSSDPPPVRELLMSLIRRAGSRSRPLPLPRHLAHAALWCLHAVRIAPLVPEQFRIADVDYVLDTTRAGQTLGWRPRLFDPDMLFSAYCTYVDGRSRHGDSTC